MIVVLVKIIVEHREDSSETGIRKGLVSTELTDGTTNKIAL